MFGLLVKFWEMDLVAFANKISLNDNKMVRNSDRSDIYRLQHMPLSNILFHSRDEFSSIIFIVIDLKIKIVVVLNYLPPFYGNYIVLNVVMKTVTQYLHQTGSTFSSYENVFYQWSEH